MKILVNKQKIEILDIFKKNFDKIEHEYNKYTRLRINNDEKYINKNFETYYLNRNIRREFIIVEKFSNKRIRETFKSNSHTQN